MKTQKFTIALFALMLMGVMAVNAESGYRTGPHRVDPTRPMIALTSDDGPFRVSAKMMDAAYEYDAILSFMVVGQLLEKDYWRTEIVKRMHREGHEVLGHSWTHRRLSMLAEAEIRNELVNTHAVIENIIGTSPRLFRAPHSDWNERVEQVARREGFAIAHWSIDPRDWETQDPALIARRIMGSLHDGAIVVLHCTAQTAEALRIVLPQLKARGFQAVTVSELLYYRGVEMIPGRVYSRVPAG